MITRDLSADVSPVMARLLALPAKAREDVIRSLPPKVALALRYDWRGFWARPAQLWTPGPRNEIYLGGRGSGKTRPGAENVRYVAANPELCGGRRKRDATDTDHGEGGWIGIAGRTANDVNVTMLYGPSGIMTISPPWFRPRHYRTDKLLVWPNGVRARLMSGDVPESFRGPNLGFLWCDELAHWKKLAASLSAALDSLRHGKYPRLLVTTSPLPVQPLLELVYEMTSDKQPIPAADRPDQPSDGQYVLNKKSRVSFWSSYDNIANLSSGFVEDMVSRHSGTDAEDTEVHGRIVWGRKGSPWRYDWIQRIDPDDMPRLAYKIVAIDPTVSDGEVTKNDEPCECGIVALGLDQQGDVYLLEDASGLMGTRDWALKAYEVYQRWECDEFVVEDNQGGELVETNIRIVMPNVRTRVRRVHATVDKWTRYGLVAPLWEAKRVHHLNWGGAVRHSHWARFEHQICNLDPKRPLSTQATDRADAATWGVLALVGDGTDRKRVRALSSKAAWAKIVQTMARRRTA